MLAQFHTDDHQPAGTGFSYQLLARAQAGSRQDQLLLGQAYAKGLGVPRDLKQSALWLRRAAGDGHAVAQNNLGTLYFEGLGERTDPVAAVLWWEKAAAQSEANAISNLGHAYLTGVGVQKDAHRAFSLFRKAAEIGLAVAQHNLGVCYENARVYLRTWSVRPIGIAKLPSKGLFQLKRISACFTKRVAV